MSKKQSKWEKMLIFVTSIIFVCVILCKPFFESEHTLICTFYKMQTNKIQKSIRLVQITDLHNSIFGENNQDLLDLVTEQSPDLILITGDLLNSNESETDIATNLISGLV